MHARRRGWPTSRTVLVIHGLPTVQSLSGDDAGSQVLRLYAESSAPLRRSRSRHSPRVAAEQSVASRVVRRFRHAIEHAWSSRPVLSPSKLREFLI